MAVMGLRLAQRANGVSRLHGDVSRAMFAGLWPGFDPDEVPIRHITNGVHALTWVARPVLELAAREIGPELTEGAKSWDEIEHVADESVWAVRRELRENLIGEVRRRLRLSGVTRGADEAELGWIDTAFDPDILTVGFARRVPSYKRLTLMLRDPERLTALLLHPQRPMQLVVAGKSHPADDGGKTLIREIVQFADQAEVRHRIAFLPDYDISLARFLVSGCDVWLNNPLRPLEACGTSGMKSALNGGLNLSIRDGWWDELFDGENGWAIPSAAGAVDPDRRDELEAQALYDLLEGSVLPRFYESDGDQPPRRWTSMVKHTLKSLGPAVLASRMVRDYVYQLYVPAARTSRVLGGDDAKAARDLAEWRRAVRSAWPGVRVAHVDAATPSDSPELGQQLTMRAIVTLPGLTPDDVEVQAVYGRVDESDQISRAGAAVLRLVESVGQDAYRYEGEIPLASTGPFGYTVRVLPRHPLLADLADLGLVASA